MVKKPYDTIQKRDYEIFEKVVITYFRPIAQKHGFPLVKIKDKVYEMPSSYFILRIAVHCEPGSRILATTLRQVTLCDFVDRKSHSQFAVGWFKSFAGVEKKPFRADRNANLDTDDDFLEFAQMAAEDVEHFAVPYLLGQKDDFEAVREFVEKYIENNPSSKEIRRIQQRIEHNPKVVQAWPVVIPREKGEEWETAKEFRATNFQFLGDLNGKKEQIFKEKLVEFFKRDRSVNKAYLARIIGFEIPATSALCLRTQFGFDKGMMEKIGKIFAHVFSIQENFNVVFLTEQQELSLAEVGRPFFEEK